MTTSGSTDFDLTRNQIIELAFHKVGAFSLGNALTPEQYELGSKLLNAMVKNWTADDIYLWKLDWTSQGLTTSSVVLGSDGFDYQCIRGHTASAGNKPITGANYMSYWKKLTTSAGGAWVTSTAYTSINNIVFDSSVIGIEQIKIREGVSDRLLTRMTEEEYLGLGNITSEGKPAQFYFRQQALPELYLYPYPDSASNYIIEPVLYRYAEDFDIGTNTPDFLQEWILPLIDGLSNILAPGEGIFGDQKVDLIKDANSTKKIARGSNVEKGDTFFVPRLK